MRRLVWLLLVGCSSSGNSTQMPPADPPAPTPRCSDVALPDVTPCPDSYSPATDGPEQLCAEDDAGLLVGSTGGFAFVWRVWADGSTECYYDGGSAALVGFRESAGSNYRCSGTLPEVDPDDAAAITRLQCLD